MTTLTWWEFEELTDHLSSRPDIWIRSAENDALWIRMSDEDGSLECGIIFVPPASTDSPFRVYHLQEVPYDWSEEHTRTYVEWLVVNWTTRSHRLEVERFLRDELKVDPETANIAAIAIESFDWTAALKEPEPAPPPTQSDLWPREAPPRVLLEDRNHLGTFLLSGGSGWLRLRLMGGMIKIQTSVRAKNGEALALDGFVRPNSGDIRTIAAKLAGWTDTILDEIPDPQPVLPPMEDAP